MPELEFAFLGAALLAGVLMFLAPCTLPLVPAYLAFIGGVKQADILSGPNSSQAHRAVIRNAIAFVATFSVTFITLGILAGFAGAFIAPFRGLLSQLGGLFIILFGLHMLGVFRFASLLREHKLALPTALQPGRPSSAALIGFIFALGWTPCIGPVLASILLIASTTATAFTGGLLLAVFSLGLAIPFLLSAILYSRAVEILPQVARVATIVNYIGGIVLLGIGLLLLTEQFGVMVAYGSNFFYWLGLEGLFDYL